MQSPKLSRHRHSLKQMIERTFEFLGLFFFFRVVSELFHDRHPPKKMIQANSPKSLSASAKWNSRLISPCDTRVPAALKASV